MGNVHSIIPICLQMQQQKCKEESYFQEHTCTYVVTSYQLGMLADSQF